MKKLLVCLVMLLVLAGCGAQDDADATGRYGLIPKGEGSSLVVHWVYPDEAFDADFDTVKLDLSHIEKYIDPDADLTGCGITMNTLQGVFGYGRAFLKAEPIGLNESAVKKVVQKKLPIYLHIESTDGRSVKVRLQYDKSIHD